MTVELDADAFLSHFFGPGNELSLASLEDTSPDLAVWLRARISDLRGDPSAAHVLPRRSRDEILWYGLAHSGRQLRTLLEELNAFVGPSYANLALNAPELDSKDPVERAVLSYTDGHATTFKVLPGAQRSVRTALDLRRSLEHAKPLRDVALARPLGRLLREFEMAVTVREPDASEALLEALERTGQLSTQNVIFLRIRRLAALRRWNDLLSLPEMSAVLAVRRPTNLTAAILTAVYMTELAGYEVSGDAAGAVSHLEDIVLPRFPSLFKSRSGLLNPEALKSFMLLAAAASPPRSELRDEILALRDVAPEDRDYLEAIAGLLPEAAPTAPADPLGLAMSAALAGDFDRALLVAREQPPSRERAELLIRCAVEIDSLIAMSAAVTAMGEITEDQRVQVLSSRWFRGPWDEILRRVEGVDDAAPSGPPQAWSEWLGRLIDNGAWPGALQVAERGAMEWSYDTLATDQVELTKVLGLLNRSLDPSIARVVRDSVPYMLQFIDRGEPSVPAFRELYEDLLVLLLAGDDPGVADLQAVIGLVSNLLDLGTSAPRYREMVDDVRALWDRMNAATNLDAALEVLDLLVMHSAPDAPARDALFQSILASFSRWHRRVGLHQWDLLEDLAADLGARSAVTSARGGTTGELAGVQSSSSLKKALAGKRIGIYTLIEPVAARVKEFLERHFDDVEVETNHDHVATEQLRTLARTADLLLVAPRSAKHAATTYIETERPANRPTLYAVGKGSASMMRAIYGYLGST